MKKASPKKRHEEAQRLLALLLDTDFVLSNDRQLGERLGLCLSTITAERRRRGLPLVGRSLKDQPIDPIILEKAVVYERYWEPSRRILWENVPDHIFIGRDDYELAVFFQTSPSTIRKQRQRRRLPKARALGGVLNFSSRVTDEILATWMPTEITYTFRCSYDWVKQERIKRGIAGPSYPHGGGNSRHVAWERVSNELFWLFSDARLAAHLHLSQIAVCKRRRVLCIPEPGSLVAKLAMISSYDLATWPTWALMRAYNLNEKQVEGERRLRQIVGPLPPTRQNGVNFKKMSDGEIAKKTGAARWWVRLERQKHDCEIKESRPNQRVPLNRITNEQFLSAPDEKLASQTNVPKHLIAEERLRRGIGIAQQRRHIVRSLPDEAFNVSDQDLAKSLSECRHGYYAAVQEERARRGLPAPVAASVEPTAEEGEHSDSQQRQTT